VCVCVWGAWAGPQIRVCAFVYYLAQDLPRMYLLLYQLQIPRTCAFLFQLFFCVNPI